MFAPMNQSAQFDELMTSRLSPPRRALEPCSIVIFGASGDLAGRKLIPALYQLTREKQMPPSFRVVGFARRPKTDETWRSELRKDLEQFSRTKPIEEEFWNAFSQHVHYCQGDLNDAQAYARLEKQLSSFGDESIRRNVMFYLATPPSQFAPAVQHLHDAGLFEKDPTKGWQRVVVEKPFGSNLESAEKLNRELATYAHEQQVFRIDHYLGKETVQNILMFRFSNSIFERIWNRESIDHVQITVSEQVGVGQRGNYYEEAGALRDMVQNHLLQVLSLTAMEPPVSLDAEAIRDEKVKLLKSIRPVTAQDNGKQVVRGQYFAGTCEDKPVPGYRQEQHVNPASNVETFVALRMFIDNWRWSGVPFFLRTGKRLPVSASEVHIQFRRTPNVLFAAECGQHLDANSLTLRLQPNEGIALRFNGKVPGISTEVRPVRMNFSYDVEFGAYTPEAYERLLLEAMSGDATLFTRRDEVETAWRLIDGIRESWSGKPLSNREFYAAGTWGPVAAEDLIGASGHQWHEPKVS